MSLCSVVLLTFTWIVICGVFTGECESPRINKIHQNRHKFNRRHLFSDKKDGKVRHQRDNPLPQLDPSSLELDDVVDDGAIENDFELDKPLPVEQVAVPVGGKAYLPCDTRSPNQDLRLKTVATESSGFFMVMWFREQKETDPEYDQNYERQSSIPSTSGEPIFTYDTRQSSSKISNVPKWWSSPLGFGDRAYFHAGNDELHMNGQDHLTVDRAMATDTGIYRCRVDFLKAPTRNRLVNLTVIVAPDRPKIYVENKNAVGGDRQENDQNNSENVFVIDEGTETLILVCRVTGGWPRPRLTWYHENTVLDLTYQLLNDDDLHHYRDYHKRSNRNRSKADGRVTVNRLSLTNLTRWHPIMSQQLQTTTGMARLTCQASNSISTGGVSRPLVITGPENLPPPATTEHAVIRLNLKPTDVQITSVREIENNLKDNKSQSFDISEVLASEDVDGHTKYTIRAGRMYRAECQSKGSRPTATIEWYLLKKNQRYNVGQSTNGTTNSLSYTVRLLEKLGGTSTMEEGTIASIVETQQAPTVATEKYKMIVTTSILSFMLRGPKSAIAEENDEHVSILGCRTYNPVIKTFERHYVETKIAMDVQYPPIVELRFGNRMLDTGQIGPGDDVYFECVARANPSTTIRYSWYQNGVRLTQDAEKRTDDSEKKDEKKNSRLAGRVIQYSELGILVLQSVKIGAAGNYVCQATNGIDVDSDNNRTISNIVRLYVKHVPVCKHREELLITVKRTDTMPLIRCRAGRGHPPTFQYRWTFYPEQATEREPRNGESPQPNDLTFAGRSTRELDLLLAETAVLSPDGGISYTFTSSTPVLKSYLTAVKAAASVFSNAVRPNFFRGRLECQAVNSVGTQQRPCVYRITDETTLNQGNKDLQEIVDCRPTPRNTQSNKLFNETNSCSAEMKAITNSTNRKTRFCITCALNTSLLHFHQRFNYILQLLKITKREISERAVVAFNVTGITMNENIGTSKNSFNELEGDDYYTDPEEEITHENKGEQIYDDRNGVQRVVFVIDDGIAPGIYQGRIYNNDEDAALAMVKGMINVPGVSFDGLNENDFTNSYIIDDIKDDTNESTIFGYAWNRVTVTLAEMFSMVTSSSSSKEFNHNHHEQKPLDYWHTVSVILTTVLIVVVVALCCGICVVVAILLRQYYYHRTNSSQVYNFGGNNDDENISESIEKTIIGEQKTEEIKPTPNGLKVRGSIDEELIRPSRATEYVIHDSSNNNYSETSVPLLQQHRLQCQLNEKKTASRPLSSTISLAIRCDNNTDIANTSAPRKNTTVVNCDNSSGPDIVMSTAIPLENTEKSSYSRQKKPQSEKIKFNTINSNHQRPSHRIKYQKPIHHSRQTATVVLTNKITNPNTYKTVIEESPSMSSKIPFSTLHRESSI